MEAGLDPATVAAVAITHEHSDHVAHAGPVCRGLGVPLIANRATVEASETKLGKLDEIVEISGTESFKVGDLKIEPVRKPHDAVDALSFLVHHQEQTMGFFTDLGHVDDGVAEAIQRCDALIMEANHDPEMLMAGPYPLYLQRRVGGHWGHISNEDSAAALARCLEGRLKLLVLGHLSSKNNHPDLVRAAFVQHMGEHPGFPRYLSRQDRATPRFTVDGQMLARSEASETSSA